MCKLYVPMGTASMSKICISTMTLTFYTFMMCLLTKPLAGANVSVIVCTAALSLHPTCTL